MPRPELAEEFSANAAVTEWTFKIRKGVTFHDGSKLTADDVVWTMNRHTADNSKSVAKVLVAGVNDQQLDRVVGDQLLVLTQSVTGGNDFLHRHVDPL